MESFYRVALFLKGFETRMIKNPCNPSVVQGEWQTLWRRFRHVPSAPNWGEVIWGDKEKEREAIQVRDLRGIGTYFNVRLSCSDRAKIVNKILGDNHCCISVSCSAEEASSTVIPAGTSIDPIFE